MHNSELLVLMHCSLEQVLELEQALEQVTRFVDDAIMVGVSEIKILHGKGNGILREEIRKYLKTMWGVTNFRDEVLEMGGSGITVVKLDN